LKRDLKEVGAAEIEAIQRVLQQLYGRDILIPIHSNDCFSRPPIHTVLKTKTYRTNKRKYMCR
jgi:hypothetical protein